MRESVKEYAAKKKLKKYDIATQQKKQFAGLSGVEGVAYVDHTMDYDATRFSAETNKFAINTRKLFIVAKRKDGKYVYLHNFISDKSRGIECEMNVAIFDTWEKLWNKLPPSIRREIK